MYKQLIIVPDLTKQQREEEKALREELNRKREMGEHGWYIKRGKLVQGNFQNH